MWLRQGSGMRGWGRSGHAGASSELPATSGGTGTHGLGPGDTRTPSRGQHLHIQGCTDYNGDAGTTTTELYRPRFWEHKDGDPREAWTSPAGMGSSQPRRCTGFRNRDTRVSILGTNHWDESLWEARSRDQGVGQGQAMETFPQL